MLPFRGWGYFTIEVALVDSFNQRIYFTNCVSNLEALGEKERALFKLFPASKPSCTTSRIHLQALHLLPIRPLKLTVRGYPK